MSKKYLTTRKGYTCIFNITVEILPRLHICTVFDWQVNMLTVTQTVQNTCSCIDILSKIASVDSGRNCVEFCKKKIKNIRYTITVFVDGTWRYTFFTIQNAYLIVHTSVL